MTLFTFAPDGKGPLAVVAGAAEFAFAERFHGQGVIRVGASRLLLEKGVVAIAAVGSGFLMFGVIEHHGSEAFGVLENNFPRSSPRQNLGRSCKSQPTCGTQHRTPQKYPYKPHRVPFSKVDLF